MKKIFCCPALELFHCLPLWKTVLFVNSRAFLLSTPTFLLSTPVENSEATWKKATKCNKHFFYIFHPTSLLPGPDILLPVSNCSQNFYQCSVVGHWTNHNVKGFRDSTCQKFWIHSAGILSLFVARIEYIEVVRAKFPARSSSVVAALCSNSSSYHDTMGPKLVLR